MTVDRVAEPVKERIVYIQGSTRYIVIEVPVPALQMEWLWPPDWQQQEVQLGEESMQDGKVVAQGESHHVNDYQS